MTSEHSQPTLFDETELPLMSSAAASRVRTFPSLESALALKVRDLVCGVNTGASLARYDHASSSWRTSQACLVSGWEPFSETWPRSGTMQRGTAYPLPPSAPLTGEIASGLLPTPAATANMMAPSMQKWPTPRANDAEKRGNFDATNQRNGLPAAVKMWPTPTGSLGTKGWRVTPRKSSEGGTLIEAVSARRFATPTSRDWRSGKTSPETLARNARPLSEQIGGSLNPTWVEWLMGFPLGWTVLELWATRLSRKSQKQSAARS